MGSFELKMRVLEATQVYSQMAQVVVEVFPRRARFSRALHVEEAGKSVHILRVVQLVEGLMLS